MPNVELANAWLRYAKMDYDVAVHDTNLYPLPIEIVCYHAQQAGEKALKAVLAYYGQEIPRTHDLFRLLELCAEHFPDLMDCATAAKRLTDYAVITRYPSMVELELTDMTNALAYAKQLLDAAYAHRNGAEEI